MALSTALSENVTRSHEFDIHHGNQDLEGAKKRETDFLHTQIESEVEARARARAQAEVSAQVSRENESEMQVKVQAISRDEKEELPAQRQNQRRRYCRSSKAREQRALTRRFRETRHKQGRRTGTNAVHNPVGCATIPPVSAVPLFQYFRRATLSPSPSPPSTSPWWMAPSSSSSSRVPSPFRPLMTPSFHSSRNLDAEQVARGGPKERAEKLQELYESESAVHAHAATLARGIRGVQPHGRIHAADGSKRDSNDNAFTADTIASVAATYSRHKTSNVDKLSAADSRKLNAAAAPFVSNQINRYQDDDSQGTKNSSESTDLHHERATPFGDYRDGHVSFYTYPSAWELGQASDPFHDTTEIFSSNSGDDNDNNKSNVGNTSQLRLRSGTNPFPSSSALSSFTPSLDAHTPLKSPLLSPDPGTGSSTSKESLSSFLAEESDLLSLQLAHNLRRQHAELELEQALAQATQQQSQKPRRQQYERIRETFVVVIKDFVRAVSERVDGTAAERWSMSPSSDLAAEKVVGRAAVEVKAGEGRWMEHKEESVGDFMLPPPALPLWSLKK